MVLYGYKNGMSFPLSASRGSVCFGVFRVIPALVLVALLVGCGADEPTVFGGETMGTTWSVAIADPLSEQQYAELREETKALLEGVNQSMSNWLPDSEISRINGSTSVDWQPVSPGLLAVLAESLEVHRFSKGYFDITVSPLVRLWGFGPGSGDVTSPSEQEIHAVLPEVGSEKLQLRPQPPALRKSNPKLQLDLSAIAKGYAVDVLSEHLHSLGFDNFMVEIGGDLRVSGRNQEGAPWRIGLERPAAGERAVSLAIALKSGGGVASSGGYRNFVEANGERYSHGIDPHSGRPVDHDTVMVTVVADTAMWADALATAFYVMGSEKGLPLAAREKVAAAFFTQENETLRSVFSDAFKPLLVQ